MATPLVVEHGGRAQVVTPAMNHVYGYDLETGETVWRSRGTTMNAIPSPVHADGMVYVTSGYRGNNLQAIRLADARGDITGTGAIVWQLDRDTPYVPSPLLYDDALYLLKSNDGILSVFDPATGAPHYALQRLAGLPNVFASPVGAAGRVYIAGRDGTTLVIRHGPATRCSPPTPSTTASTPRRPSSTTSCTCAATGISTRSRPPARGRPIAPDPPRCAPS